MPAKLDVDREAVRTLVVAVGVREAARQMNLPEDTVCSWAARGKWIPAMKAAQSAAKVAIASRSSNAGQITVQANASKPADSLANHLAEAGRNTRLNLVKAAGKAASSFAERSGAAVIESAQAFRHITAAASTLHGWEEKGSAGVVLNLGLMIGSMD